MGTVIEINPLVLTCKVFTAVLVALSVGLTTIQGNAAPSVNEHFPPLPDVDWQNIDENAPLPRSLMQIARDKSRAALNAPRWLKELLHTKVRSYFPLPHQLRLDRELPSQDIERLLQDSSRVAVAFEEDDRSGQFRNFVSQNLAPYIRALKPKDIATGLGQWTVQTLVVSRMLNALSKSQNFSKNALNLITGPHLKGATRAMAFLIFVSVGYYVFPSTEMVIGLFILKTFWDSFKAGPLGTVTNAGFGWFVRPTSEQAKVMESRFFAKWEVHINDFYDRLNPKTDPALAQTEGADDGISDRNDRVKIAKLETDGMDFAGMVANDQILNWEDALNMFVVVAKRFGQLLRDTHHAGRDLMMLSWTDQQNITQLVETMDSKGKILRSESLAVLNPHKTAFLLRGENEKKINLEAAFEDFEGICNKIWQDPDQNENSIRDLAREVERARDRLAEFGLSSDDIKRLLVIQYDRARAMGTLITTLAIGELRAFYGAERNRNLAAPARVIERTVRHGLGMQKYVDEHLPLVQRELRTMGLRVSGRPKLQGVALQKCLIVELRTSFRMPAVSTSNTEMCSKLLWGRPERPRFDTGPEGSPISKLLAHFQDQAQRNEVIAVINEAAFTQARALDLQMGAKTALENCAN
jgi:hypothetical protein